MRIFLPYNSEGAVADRSVGLHIRRDGRRLVVGRRSRQDGALRRARRSLHQRHRHTHGDARVPRGAADCRHPTVTAHSSATPHSPTDTQRDQTITRPLPTLCYHRLLLYYSCSNDYAGIGITQHTTENFTICYTKFHKLCMELYMNSLNFNMK